MSVTILRGHVLDRLRELPDESVHMCVTSPPYYGLRDYGVPGQLGLEPTLQEYLDNMVAVFREVRRVLRSDGTLWLNIGDSYATGAGAVGNCPGGGVQGEKWAGAKTSPNRMPQPGYKPKDLMGVPWRLAFALQADGWYLRSDIIWHKRSTMPESVRDRPTKSHEHIFLLAKSESYYYDQVAASEPCDWDMSKTKRPDGWDTSKGEGGHGSFHKDGRAKGERVDLTVGIGHNERDRKAVPNIKRSGNKERKPASARGVPVDTNGGTNGAVAGSIPWEGSTRNWRDVWSLGPEPFKEAHFATFPTEIPRRAIVAGTSEKGCCPSCGAGWVRREEVVGRQVTDAMRYAGGNENGEYHGQAVKEYDGTGAQNASDTKRRILERMSQVREHSWAQGCSCPPADPVPATILDPFLGSGTTALVADRLQRDCIGIELNPAYADMAERRIRADSPLFSEVA